MITEGADRGRLVSGLAAAARERRGELLALAERIADTEQVQLVRAPTAGSVLIELDSPIGTAVVGEALVTTARTRVGDRYPHPRSSPARRGSSATWRLPGR
jgi:alpha-D-ribose 1-methylphosphonate 5-triphosphate synthase subunit PhnG